MRLGLWGARADGGGLAAMTSGFAEHLHPERTLIIDLGAAGRGSCHPERYEGPTVVVHGMDDAITPTMIDRFAAGLDVIYACETWYREDVVSRFRERGVRTVLHAMPELFRPEMSADRNWIPTPWGLDRMPPGTRVVSVPVDRERFPPRQGLGRPSCWLHLNAPAMLDRDGRRTVVDALAHVKEPVEGIFVGGLEAPPKVINEHKTKVRVRWIPGGFVDREDAFLGECEGLVLPRRYAGLSLPMQEAASLGWPVVTTDLMPQSLWAAQEGLVPAWERREVRMVGGRFPVHECSPVAVAAVMDRLATDWQAWEACRQASEAFAARLDWRVWEPEYRRLLEQAAA